MIGRRMVLVKVIRPGAIRGGCLVDIVEVVVLPQRWVVWAAVTRNASLGSERG